MSKQRQMLALALAATLAVSTIAVAHAAEQEGNNSTEVTLTVEDTSNLLRVKVPTEIEIYQDAEGTNTVADSSALKLENLGGVNAEITGIQYAAEGDWTLVDYDTEAAGLANEARGTKKITFEINGDGMSNSGSFTLTPDSWDITAYDELGLSVKAALPMQNVADYSVSNGGKIGSITWSIARAE